MRREVDPSDRRRVIIHPLPERLAAIAPHYQGMAAAWTDLLAAYSDEQLALFLDLFDRMHQLSQQQLASLPTTRPATHEVSHAVVIVLELGGAVSILAAFTLSQLRLLDQHSLVYLILNLVGSAVLAVIAFADQRWASCSWRASGRSSRR